MTVTVVIIVILAVIACILAVFLVKNIILPQRAASAAKLLDKSNILQSIRKAKAAIEKDPKNAEAHYLLGKAYLADKREEQALREFRSVSRLGIEGKNIPDIEFRETIARLYTKFHEEEEALKEYIFLIKRNPENSGYYFQAGKLFAGRNRGDLAEQYLRKAVSLNPREESYRIELGMHYYLSKRFKEAEGEFEAALRLNAVNAETQLYLGKIRKESKDYAGAIPYLEKAERDQEYKLRALVELGSCYMSLRMMDKAIPVLERAVDIIEDEAEPNSLYARYFLAMCFEKRTEFAKAMIQWDKIYAIKKNFRDVGEKLTCYAEYRQENEDRESPERP